MTTITTTAELDWDGSEEIAARLGARTRRLVADRDADAVIEWAGRKGRDHRGPAANTYVELAVLLEPPAPEVEDPPPNVKPNEPADEPEPDDDQEQNDGHRE